MALTTTVYGGNVQLTGNPCRVQVSGGSFILGAHDYKLLLKIESEDGKLEGAPYIDAIAPKLDGTAMFDVSGYVDQPVKAVFQYPPSGAYTSYATQAFNVQFTAGESYIDEDGVLVTNWESAGSVYQFLKGGLNPRQLAYYNSQSTNFYEQYIENRRWLTPRPWGAYVHPTQPVKLWFMVPAGVSATYKVRGTYTDESTDTYSLAVSLSADNLYEFNCNPAHLGLTLEPTGKRMNHFDVWLESGGSTISDTRRFTVDWRPCERPLFVLFQNSLGGVDDVFFSGYMTEHISVEGNTVYKPHQASDTVLDPTLITPNRQGQNKWKLNSGYKTSTEAIYLRDLMVARQAWILYPNVGITSYSVIPVIIESADAELVNRKKDLYNVAVQLAEAHTSQFTFDNRVF